MKQSAFVTSWLAGTLLAGASFVVASAQPVPSVRLSNGETLTAEEVEFGLDAHANASDRFEQIRAKVKLAGSDAIPLYRYVIADSDDGFVVANALSRLEGLRLDRLAAAEVVDTLSERPLVLASPAVQGRLLVFMRAYTLASRAEAVLPLLGSDRSSVRWTAFEFAAAHGDAPVAQVLKEELPGLLERELAELEDGLQNARVIFPKNYDFGQMRERGLQSINERHAKAKTALAEMRIRLDVEPGQADGTTEQVEAAVGDSSVRKAELGADSPSASLDSATTQPEATPIPWTIVISSAVGLLAVVAGVVGLRRRASRKE